MNPKISIITVCFNSVNILEQTIMSVTNQLYDNIEYIIIDGGSKDGTVDIIKKHESKITYWVSEPDNGIYDAMNKGIKHATGEWINFMNAGDSFASFDIISTIFIKNYSILKNKSAIYGDSIVCISLGEKYSKCIKPFWKDESFIPDKGFSHQSSFVRSDYAKLHPFDTSFKICADFKMLYDLYKADNKSFVYIPFAIAKYEVENGFSKQNATLAYKENALIIGKNKHPLFFLYYFKFKSNKIAHDYLSSFLKKNFPKLFNYIKMKRL